MTGMFRSFRAVSYTHLDVYKRQVWPSAANFIMMQLPEGCGTAAACFEALLQRGIIIRPLKKMCIRDRL